MEDRGLWVCFECGSVLDRVLISVAEWSHTVGNVYDALMPPCQYHLQLSGGDVMQQNMHAWRKSSTRERSTLKSYDHLSAYAKNISRSVVQDAKATFKNARDQALVARQDPGVLAACVFLACKANGAHRSACEIAAMYGLADTSPLSKTLKRLECSEVPAATAAHFVARFASHVRIPEATTRLAEVFASRATARDLVPMFVPPTVAAACIMLACTATDVKLSQRAMGQASGASPNGIGRCQKALRAHTDILFEPAESKFRC